MSDDDDDLPGAAGFYDPDPEAGGGDDWFAAEPLLSIDADLQPVWPDAADWRAAQAARSGELAALAYRQGMLGERLARMGSGALHRLALQEVADLSWWAGDRLSADRLALWLGQHAGAAGDDAAALARAGWALRRLTQAERPGSAALSAFLGRTGATVEGDLAELSLALAALSDLHPAVQAAAAFQLWRASGPGREVEAAVLAARLGGVGAGFLPLALAGGAALRAQGAAPARLGQWLAGAEQAAVAALLALDRLADWQARATGELADLSGRTPGMLVAALLRWPMLTAPLAEQETGASRAAVQRNLDLLQTRGLIREVTGQGRFRVWAARV